MRPPYRSVRTTLRRFQNTNYLGPAVPITFDDVDHGGLPNDSRVIDCIKRVLAGQSEVGTNRCGYRNAWNVAARVAFDGRA